MTPEQEIQILTGALNGWRQRALAAELLISEIRAQSLNRPDYEAMFEVQRQARREAEAEVKRLNALLEELRTEKIER